MKRFTSRLFKSFAALALAAAGSVFAQGAGPVEGRDFTVVPQQPTQSPGKIEVLEFFQYACVHCFHLEPMMAEWEKKLSKDVVIRRVPLSFDPSRTQHVRMFYVLESLNRLSDLHIRAFNAIHLEKRFLMTPEEQADFFAGFSVDKAKYMELYNSFTVQTKTTAAQKTFPNFKLEGTPALAVDGRYIAAPTQAGHAEMLRTVDALIERVRKEKGMKPAAAAPAQPAAKPAAAPAAKSPGAAKS